MSIKFSHYLKRGALLPLILFFQSGCAHTVIPSIEVEKLVVEKSTHSDQPDSHRHFAAGMDYVKNRENEKSDFKSAAKEFASALSIKPDFQEARLNLGLAYLNLGKFEEAIKQFKEVGESSQEVHRQKALLSTGVSYLKMGRLDEAVRSLESLPEGENYDTAILLGKIHRRLGERDAAIGDFERAIELSPSRPEAYQNLGDIYMTGGDKPGPKAINNFLKVAKLQPNNAEASFKLGVLYYQSGEVDRAVKMFRKVTMLSADAGAAYYNLGLIHYGRSDLRNAIMYFTLAKSYSYSPAIVALTKIYLDENRFDVALNIVKQFLVAKKDYPEAYCSLGAILQKAGRSEEAKTAYLNALQLSPKNIMALNNLAVIYRELGEFDKALDTNYKILRIDPNFPYAHKNLGIIYDIFLNDYKVAKYHYSEYLRVGPDKEDEVESWLKELDNRGKS